MPQVHRSPCTAVAGRSFCESGIFGYGGAEWTRCGRCTSPLFDAWVLTCLKQEMGHNHREQTQLVDQHPNIDHSMTIFGMRRRGFQGFEWFWHVLSHFQMSHFLDVWALHFHKVLGYERKKWDISGPKKRTSNLVMVGQVSKCWETPMWSHM